MINHQFMRFVARAMFFGAVVTVTAACSDATSEGVANLTPFWQLDIDTSRNLVVASGYVSDVFDEPDQLLNGNNTTPLLEQAVRLTAGDTLSVAWAGSNWQLFRRDAEFLYSRTFPLPPDNPAFEARFDRSNGEFDSIVVNATIPDLSSVMLVEEGLEVNGTGSLNLSWEIDTSVHDLRSQLVQVSLLTCNELPMDAVVIDLDVDITARALSIPASDLPSNNNADSQSCRYAISLSADTVQVDAAGRVDMTTRSRLMEAIVDFAAES